MTLRKTLNEAAIRLRVDGKRRHKRFQDFHVVDVKAGAGGNGAVAFTKTPTGLGPPTGGSGGSGGSVTFSPNAKLNSLHTIPSKIRAANGASGSGDGRLGKRGADTVIDIPPGTVIRELWRCAPPPREDRNCSQDEDTLTQLRRDRAWLHYPGMEEANSTHPLFLDADKELRRSENLQLKRYNPLHEQEHALEVDISDDKSPHLIVSGGLGGVGNPAFVTHQHRSPKFARKGQPGGHVKLSLEMKLLAHVGLVGLPNAGKSSILAAITSSKTKVANYAFTTLKPEIGVVGADGEGEGEGAKDALTPSHRFTILDNPGLIADAALNKGLGHTFLRSVERALVLVFVVDLSSLHPLTHLHTLIHELNEYKSGLARAGTVIVANKADLLGGDEQQNAQAKHRLSQFTDGVQCLIEGGTLDPSTTIIPISAKHEVNLDKLKRTLGERVRRRQAEEVS
ncbi:hypothetical protein E3P89_01087 [Wallemia ichthyophaga]|uniref:Uncharacterized protein n=1 Tax=Wallemia ichthyophaga TaxID=245174 RepID=A0A4V4M0R0_WALIC|nr:hypothetical protein E3P90_01487 [Wallemia ichthyophaga]TIB15614.1 hypothetical protein E3P93_01238 [Wallemia ichthyophaga]TIB24222.1 hypothetical protein E3P89_01087 [Wallemia ichthyophaga]TIB25602.1 hypothetical protein E3P88_01442 [Wallemia ichthyophaga]